MRKIFFKAPQFIYWILPVALYSSTVSAYPATFIQKPTWDVGIQALYLKPSYTDGFAYLDDTRVSPNKDRRNPLKLNWGWGFKVEGSYHYCPDSDINLNWYHYKKPSNGTFVFRTNPTADHYTVTPEWNAVNLEFGEGLHLDQLKNIRLHGGLQYAEIRTTYHGNGVDPITGPGAENDVMQYNGVGPRIGMDMSVGIIGQLSGYFGGDAAMLVGRSKFNFNETFGTGFAITGSRPTVVVPEMGLKIGARYDYTLCNNHLLFDVGYLFVNYFNPLHLSDDFSSSESNFALNGLNMGVKWMFG